MEVRPGRSAGIIGKANKLAAFDRRRPPSFDITSVKVGIGSEEADGFAGGRIVAGTDNSDVVAITSGGVIAGLEIVGLDIVSGLDGSIHRRAVVDGLAFGDETDGGDNQSDSGGHGRDRSSGAKTP